MQNIENSYIKPTNPNRLTLLAQGISTGVAEKQVAIPPNKLQGRINTQLCMDGSAMQVLKSVPKHRSELGDYIIWNMESNMLEGVHVDLAGLANQLHVLDADEYVA